jgi:hypothetical protein
LSLLGAVYAHDYEKPGLAPWFMSLHSKRGMPCCDGKDAVHLSDVDWQSHDGHYQVRLNGKWVDVPDDAVVDEPNRDGSTLVWPYYIDGDLVGVHCFMPGTMG